MIPYKITWSFNIFRFYILFRYSRTQEIKVLNLVFIQWKVPINFQFADLHLKDLIITVLLLLISDDLLKIERDWLLGETFLQMTGLAFVQWVCPVETYGGLLVAGVLG